MNYCVWESPVGPLLIAGDDEALRYIYFPRNGKAAKPEPAAPTHGWVESATGVVAQTVAQLREYFAGKRTQFDLPLAVEGTAFQRSVWRALEEIPYGQTISYSELARRVGNPKASRAAGSANGANRIPIVIPCHRVIAAGGKLGGFGGGLPTKQFLLALESKAELRSKGDSGLTARAG